MKPKFDPAVHDDNPPLADDTLARMRPAREVHGDQWVNAQKRPRGRPRLASPKSAVKLRLDAQIVEHFKSGGPGWQTRINDTLLEAIKQGRT